MSTPNTTSHASIKVSPAVIGCFFLLGSFFLPWLNILGATVAGYELGKLSPEAQWLWAIPSLATLAMILGLTGKRHIEVAQIAGGLPLVLLAVRLYADGTELFSVLGIGAWAALASGVFLLCVAPRLRSPASLPATRPAAVEQKTPVS